MDVCARQPEHGGDHGDGTPVHVLDGVVLVHHHQGERLMMCLA